MGAEKKPQEMQSLLVELRRDFHRHPELSREETRTSAVIQEFLRNLGIEVRTFPQHAGVVGIIKGKRPGPVVGLRADMDALPIQEENDVAYRSENPGVMHACGHDAHMAILLGVAKLFAASPDFSGTVKLIFQPAEEASPLGGAQAMIDDGVLGSPEVNAVFGLHVWPDVPSGTVALRKGGFMAASDRFKVKLLGKGAHAGKPHQGVDALAMAADALQGFGHIIHRKTDPVAGATINAGTIRGGERYNVVPKEDEKEGTVRTLDEVTRRDIPKHLEALLKGIAQAHGGNYELEYLLGYPSLVNAEQPYQLVVAAAESVIGREKVMADVEPVLGAEDFARFLAVVPGAFFWLGCGKQNQYNYPLHNSRFELDENCLLTGVKVMYQVALHALATYGSERRENTRLYA